MDHTHRSPSPASATVLLPAVLAVLVLCPPPARAQDPPFSGTVVGVIDGEFTSVAVARAAGYRPHKACVPLLETPP